MKDQFEKFNKFWKKRKLLVGIVVVITIIISLGNAFDASDKIKKMFNGKKDLEIVAIDIIENDSEKEEVYKIIFKKNKSVQFILWYPVLDIKLLNNTDETVYIKALEFEIENIGPEYCQDCVGQGFNSAYHISVNPKGRKEKITKTLNISNVVKPLEAERFGIILGSPNMISTFKVKVKIHYNSNKSVDSHYLNVNIAHPDCGSGYQINNSNWNYSLGDEK